jgi:hypothetical protein
LKLLLGNDPDLFWKERRMCGRKNCKLTRSSHSEHYNWVLFNNEHFWYQYLLLMLGRELKSFWIPIQCRITLYLWNSFVPTFRLCAQPNAHVRTLSNLVPASLDVRKKLRRVFPFFHHWTFRNFLPLFSTFCYSLTRHCWRGMLFRKLSATFFPWGCKSIENEPSLFHIIRFLYALSAYLLHGFFYYAFRNA